MVGIDGNEDGPRWLADAAKLISFVSLGLAIIGSSVTAVWVVSGWVTTLDAQLVRVKDRAADFVAHLDKLDANVVSIDKRLNDIHTEIDRLHATSDANDAILRGRIDVLDERTRINASNVTNHGR